MLQKLRNLGIVVVVTLLAWAFAEGESLSTTTARVRVSLANDMPGLLLTLDPDEGWDQSCELRFEGPTARLDVLRSSLRGLNAIELTTREVGTEGGLIDLADALSRHPIFDDAGVTITSAEPSRVEIVADRLVERTARVVVDPGSVPVRGLAQPEPSSIMLQIPERLAAQLPAELEVTARLNAEAVRGMTPGQVQTIFNIPIELPPGLSTSADKVRGVQPINVSLTLAARTETRTLASVPVDLRVPAVIAERYRTRVAEQEQVLSGVQVRGPTEILDQIGAGRAFTPRIELFVTPEELSARVPASGEEVELLLAGRLIGVPGSVELAEALPAIHLFVRRRADVEPSESEADG